MLLRLSRHAPWVTLAGVAVLLAGLAWDAALHRADPELAAREGIFAPGNPGHVLFGLGIALTVAGALLFLLGRLGDLRGASLARRAAFVAPAVGLLALSGASLTLALSTGGLGGPHHVHDDGTVHTHEEHQAFLAEQDAAHQHDDAAVSAAPAGGGHAHDHAAVAVSYDDLVAAARLVEEVRRTAGHWTDVRTAQAEGYRMVTRGTFFHYVNPRYYGDGRTLDPSQPESLVYVRDGSGALRLVGVMFLTAPGQEPPATGGPLVGWHRHDNLCWDAAGVVAGVLDAQGQCPPETSYRGATGSMVHIWLVDTPAGVFAEQQEVLPYLSQMVQRSPGG